MIMPAMIMLTMLPKLPATSDTIPITMLIIDNIIVTLHAQLFPFNSPQATIKEMIPSIMRTAPIATPPTPKSPATAICPPALGSIVVIVGSIELIAARPNPPTSMIIPLMIFRIAIIVTPVGLVLLVVDTVVRATKGYNKLLPSLLANTGLSSAVQDELSGHLVFYRRKPVLTSFYFSGLNILS